MLGFRLYFIFTLVLFVGVGARGQSSSSETLGSVRLSHFQLAPQLALQEPRHGGFDIFNSWLAFRWSSVSDVNNFADDKNQYRLFADLAIGTADLNRPALWYAPRSQSFDFTLAAVSWQTPYMDFSFGTQPVPFTYEGTLAENEKLLPATYVREQSWFAKIDQGFLWQSHYREFTGKVFIHNGESGSNVDNHTWSTGMWRYLNDSGFGLLLTAQVGHTDENSSGTSLAAVRSQVSAQKFAWDPGVAAKHRLASFAVFRQWQQQLLLVELGRGDIIQNDDKYPLAWGHFDVVSRGSDQLRFLFRYEQSQSDLHNSDSIIKTIGFGLSFVNEQRLSSWTVWAQKHDENPRVQNDQLLLQYKLSNLQL